MISLFALVQAYPSQIEYDLIRLGLRLRQWPDGGLSWRDLVVIVKHCPPDSALRQALPESGPSPTDTPQLLRDIEHGIRVLQWQNQGKDDHPYPEPYRWPGEKTPPPAADEQPSSYRLEEIDDAMAEHIR